MYRLGARDKEKRRRRRWLIFWLLLAVALIIAGILLKNFLHAKTSLTQSKAVITKTVATNDSTKHYDEPNFAVDIPSSWDFSGHTTSPYNAYRWKTPAKDTAAREFAVYEDTLPENFAINRALAVQPEGDHLTLLGNLSDNCSEYTKTPASVTTSGVKAKWQGIDFLCDEANSSRNVSGTVSHDGLNSVKLKGTTGPHQYFFTYDEHNINTNYTIFYRILQSFHLQ